MHTPDDPERAELRAALREVSKALIPLHRGLIDAARDDYAFGYAPVESPTHLLRLLNDDPFFAWLKPMTTLIVDIDEMARADFDRPAADAIAARLDRFFGANVDPAFAERYVPILQRDVDVAVGHAAVRQALQRLRGR
ncbi:MAG TPA: hypothetical protein VGR02_05035 [Thermoanaerobaculia bacterium]|nr:hypothetical protein [Thermoanaerobaculia bacterium]